MALSAFGQQNQNGPQNEDVSKTSKRMSNSVKVLKECNIQKCERVQILKRVQKS